MVAHSGIFYVTFDAKDSPGDVFIRKITMIPNYLGRYRFEFLYQTFLIT